MTRSESSNQQSWPHLNVAKKRRACITVSVRTSLAREATLHKSWPHCCTAQGQAVHYRCLASIATFFLRLGSNRLDRDHDGIFRAEFTEFLSFAQTKSQTGANLFRAHLQIILQAQNVCLRPNHCSSALGPGDSGNTNGPDPAHYILYLMPGPQYGFRYSFSLSGS